MSEIGPGYRTFNTSGLCFEDKHYMVDPLVRLHEVETLIAEELYFTIHAPRQTGKTTYIYALAKRLNEEGKYIALVVSFERAGYPGISVENASERILDNIYNAALEQVAEEYVPESPRNHDYIDLKEYLRAWSRAMPKPIILFVDEIDSLMDDVLVSTLRQLRDGYQSRPANFPSSIVLVGLRDVRDYKAVVRSGSSSLGTASPFNVKSDSLFLSDFTKEEVFALLAQHGDETGQHFPPEVKGEIFRLGNGQPWLTNALARQIVAKILKYDFSQPITMDLLAKAKQQLILRRDTHLDSLVDKLKEERVKHIVQAIINGDNLSFDILDDDIAYVRDLGIISQTDPLKFANPIYAEIIPRVMSSPIQASIPENVRQDWFLTDDGQLDMDRLLKEFQTFYRRNSSSWLDRYEYRESAHHLLLMAFLQRIINAGGDIVREMALGNRRIDMLVTFKDQEFALELKIKRGDYTIEDGKQQLTEYLDLLGLDHGYLIIFDPSPKDWDQKLTFTTTTHNQKRLTIVGL